MRIPPLSCCCRIPCTLIPAMGPLLDISDRVFCGIRFGYCISDDLCGTRVLSWLEDWNEHNYHLLSLMDMLMSQNLTLMEVFKD